MKVLFLTPRDSRRNIGGVEKHVRILSNELEDRKHDVIELSLDGRELGWGGKLRSWRYLWENRQVIEDADVVHIHDVFWWYLPLLILFRKRHVYTTFHGWEGLYPPSFSARIQKKMAARFSRATIGVGDFFQKWYGVSPTKATYGALDPNLLPLAQAFTAPGKTKTIAFFGRLEEINGIRTAIEAFSKLREKGFTTLFIGDGSFQLEASRVGQVTGMLRSPYQFVSQADVVIASSYLAILESLALSKIVVGIATNPLKRDYLSNHPAARFMRFFSKPNGIVRFVTSVNPRRVSNSIKDARAWAVDQTPNKLADQYEELWKQ